MAVGTDLAGDPLAGRRVQLEPLNPSHIVPVHSIVSDEPVLGGWPLQGRRLTVAEFEDLLWTLSELQYAIVRKDTHEVVGLVQAIDIDRRSRTMEIALVVTAALWHAGWPLEGIVLFLDLVICSLGYRKIYFKMPASALQHIWSAVNEWLYVEAVYRQHLRIGTGYEDQTVLSLSRAQWDAELAELVTGRSGHHG